MRLFDNFVYENGQIVDNGWVKWIHWGVPNEETEERKKLREKLAGMGHCSSCTALSGCYFLKSKIPKNQGGGGLLHPNCDCQLKQIAKPINEVKAYCAIKKIQGLYLF